jgi:hypothetical protein
MFTCRNIKDLNILVLPWNLLQIHGASYNRGNTAYQEIKIWLERDYEQYR